MDTLGYKNASTLPRVNPSMIVLYERCWKILINLLMGLPSVRYFEAPRASPMSLYKASSEHLLVFLA